MNALPVPSITRFNGVENLAAHLPTGVQKPDLGDLSFSDIW